MSDFSNYSQPDFTRALHALLPTGRAFPRLPRTVQDAAMEGLADGFYDTHRVAVRLLDVEAHPGYALELLREWEIDYGLPDPCTPASPTIVQRQAAVMAKIAATPGGQSRAYFIAVAAELGFSITITEFKPFWLGVQHFGDPLCGPGWQFVWQVNAPEITVHYFRFGTWAFGEPFWTVDVTELECRLHQLKPAHTRLNFHYG